MLEKQRIHLEGLIDELVDASLFASDCDGTDYERSAIEAKEKAGDKVKEYLDFIQSCMGTQRCASCGCTPNQLSNDIDYITREVEDDD